ncbi:MAG TPA: glycosyltransferase family 1 protein [Armatimonadetes bacterium]|nr:glycosyltransferase family 1 protein [Armatimonadota bacterium]
MIWRILYLNHTALISGAEVSLTELLRGLDRSQFAPYALLPRPGPLGERLAALRVPVEYLPLLRFKRTCVPWQLARYGANWWLNSRRLGRLLGQGFALAHANSSTAALYLAPAARRAAVPWVWQVRDLVPLGWWGRWLGQQATRIVAISQAVGEHLRESGVPTEKITVVWNGIDIKSFQPTRPRAAVRAELGLTGDDWAVGLVAQMVPWKGHSCFLEAAARVASAVPTAHFILVGEDLFGDHPTYPAQLRAWAEQLGIRDRVHFLGYRTDVADLLSALDVFVLPSRREPFGRALIEAMSLGKPVVATNLGGPREIVEEGISGLLVPPDDAAALAEALLSLARDPAWAATLGQQARQRVQTHFTLERHVAAMQEVYTALLAERA